jgi:hypothetical protein
MEYAQRRVGLIEQHQALACLFPPDAYWPVISALKHKRMTGVKACEQISHFLLHTRDGCPMTIECLADGQVKSIGAADRCPGLPACTQDLLYLRGRSDALAGPHIVAQDLGSYLKEGIICLRDVVHSKFWHGSFSLLSC